MSNVIAIVDVRIPDGRRSLSPEVVTRMAESIRELGLLNPITITPGGILLAGLHRLKACEALGWVEIPYNIADIESPRGNENCGLLWELMEIDENLIRNDLTVLERSEQELRRKRVYEQLHPDAMTSKGGRPSINPATVAGFMKDTANKTGVPARTIREDIQIAKNISDEAKKLIRHTPTADSTRELLALARMPEVEQVEIATIIAAAGGIGLREAQKEVQSRRKQEQIEQLRAAAVCDIGEGPFDVIVVDPPWPYEYRALDSTHRSRTQYPTLSIEALCALEIPAAEDCILWLWTTNAFMHEAHHLAEAWQFTVKTILTWEKQRFGLGDWLRGVTEHCLLCTKGRPVINLTNQTTILHGQAREHSRKPEDFFTMVEALCPGRKLEMYARESRDGWTVHGNETDKFRQ